jgi:hypothetical protein
MRLLIDANLSTAVAEELVRAGYEATHVAHHATDSAPGLEIAAFAPAGMGVSDAARRSRQRHPREQAGHLGAM